YLSSRGGSSTATKGAVGTNWQGSWVQVMAQIAKKKGWSLPDWRQVVQIESGGVPSILGRPTIPGNMTPGISRAFGLGQFLDGTYTSYQKYGAGSSDPVKQIEAMAQYISDRYTTPTSALGHEHGYGWYAIGGLLQKVVS